MKPTPPIPSSYPFFSERELRCPCCKIQAMNAEFMAQLVGLRTEYNAPMFLTSAYRCPSYNAHISSTGPKGPHTTGRAVDVGVYGVEAYRLLMLALKHGMTGVGIRQSGGFSSRFIHLDNLEPPFPRPNIWTY